MLHNSFRLFTVRGIEVGVHYSWLIIFALVTWSLSVYVFPNVPGSPELSAIEYWVLGAITAVVMFASVLVHELAHSFVARAKGLNPKSITLFIFGGVSNLSGEAKEASTEFLVAIVGPLMSFVLAGIFFALSTVVHEVHIDLVVSYLFIINVALGVFNLIPGFPLDGGRVLRAVLWGTTGNLRRATEWAANVGKLVAYLMFAYAAYLLLNEQIISGLWTGAIAWFLHNAASTSVQQLVFETRLKRVRAVDILRADDTTVPPEMTVGELIDRYILPANRRAVPVAQDGKLIGIVTISDIANVPPESRGATAVGQVMGGTEKLHTVQADTKVLDAFALLGEHDLEQLPVMDGQGFLGLLTRGDVARQLALREKLDA
ncbi:MAG: site-2 protease family protein [Candidatus Limnocylindrales bacterium]